MPAKVVAIIPSYNALEYAKKATESFLRHTEGGIAILVDDASPTWNDSEMSAWANSLPRGQLILHRFPENAGVTRAWNWGLCAAVKLGADYAISANSDILFTPGWFEGIERALNEGWTLVGPLTNAPGLNPAAFRQDVANYYSEYHLTDEDKYLERVAIILRERHSKQTAVMTENVNGFFQAAKVKTWMDNALNSEHIFDPRLSMNGSEDEFQARLLQRGGRLGIVPSSFIFHYRGVSRGNHDKGYYRMNESLTLLFLSCRRLGLLTRTLASAREHFDKVERDIATTYICLDNGSTPEERGQLLDMDFDLLLLARKNLGIGPAMNRLVSSVRTPYILNLQDDWLLENPETIPFVRESIRILSADARLAQVKLDKHHFTDFTDRNVYDGPFQANDGNVIYHVQNPQMQWGGFAFPPAITRMAAMWSLGPFLEEQPFRRGWAESEYATRFSKQYVAAKCPQMLLFRHIGEKPCSGWKDPIA